MNRTFYVKGLGYVTDVTPPTERKKIQKEMTENITYVLKVLKKADKQRKARNKLPMEEQYDFYRKALHVPKSKAAVAVYQELAEHFYKPVLIRDREAAGLAAMIGGRVAFKDGKLIGFYDEHNRQWQQSEERP